MRARFDTFTIDSATRRLLRGEEPVHTSTKAFDLLLLLIEARPRVLTRQQILDDLWPGTFVADGTLAGIITELRAALGDDARNPHYIRTVHRVGYAFCCDASDDGPPASSSGRIYRLLWGTREIDLIAGENILGRDRESIAWIDHPSMSRRHAAIRIDEHGRATIEDLGSKNGTFHKGHRLKGRAALADGDDVMFGSVPMKFRVFENGLSTETVHS